MNTILRKQFLAHVGQTSPEPMMIEVARAEGVFFYTPEGKHYYDLVAGVSVSNVGHANPRVVEAVQRQAADYMHIMVYGEMIERPHRRAAAGRTFERLFRQFGRRSDRRGPEARQAIHAPHGAGLDAPGLSRFDAGSHEPDG